MHDEVCMDVTEPAIFCHIDEEAFRNGIFSRGESLLAAVSGGPDSLLMLAWLASRRDRWGWKLHVAHFDHRLRPGSGEDAEFVAALCEEMDLPCSVGSADVAHLAEEGSGSVEEAARRARYSFLGQEALEHGCSKIVLAHTADDQVETVLMHIMRGTGLGGLVGMRPLSPFPRDILPRAGGLMLARPLLTIWKRDVEAAVQALGYIPRRDPTNADPSFLRNRLRMTLIPQLEFLMPGFRANLLKMSRLLADDEDYISGAVEGLWQMVSQSGSGWSALEVKSLAAAHPSLRKRLLRKAFEVASAETSAQLEEGHVSAVLDLLQAREGTAVIDLPGGSVAALDDTYLVMSARACLPRAFSSLYNLPIMEQEGVALVVAGRTRLSEEWEIVSQVLEAWEGRIWGNRATAYLDHDLVRDPVVRTRKEGDRFQPLGMEVPKKLQDFLVDEKVPAPLRDHLPLLAVGDEIAWVCGVRISERFKVTGSTRRVLRLEVRRAG